MFLARVVGGRCETPWMYDPEMRRLAMSAVAAA